MKRRTSAVLYLFAAGVTAVLFASAITVEAQTSSAPVTDQVTDQTAASKAAAKKAAAEQAKEAQKAKQEAARAAKGQKPTTTATATPGAKPGVTTPAIPAKTATTAPGAATATSGTAGPASSRTASGGAGAVGSGTLSYGTRVYTSSGCVHNGTSAVCTFTFVNQGNEATLTASGVGELAGVQMVDDAHVPHRLSNAYFLDKYGAQQKKLVVAQGDTGTYVMVFPNVDSHVSTTEFHLKTQTIGGVSVTAASSAPASETGTRPAPASAPGTSTASKR